MDANQTRMHVVLGDRDWNRWTPKPTASLSSPLDAEAKAVWNAKRNELTLRPKPFRFIAGSGDRAPKLGVAGDETSSDRCGAARDRFGNWYFISEDRRGIIAFSAGCRHTEPFWRCDAPAKQRKVTPGTFQPNEPAAAPVPESLSGLAVTIDHYLLVGTITKTGRGGGLLVFDLHAGGPPQIMCWPTTVDFAPFDMAPRRKGGVLILDRQHQCYWVLDRRLRVVAHDEATSASETLLDAFQPSEGAAKHGTRSRAWPLPISVLVSPPARPCDPVSIEELPDGSVLVLDAATQPSTVLRYEKGKRSGAPAPLSFLENDAIEGDVGEEFSSAYDFAFVEPQRNSRKAECACGENAETSPLPSPPIGQLYVVTKSGNQSTRFEVHLEEKQLRLTASPEYFPMRLFTGMGIVAADGAAFYDSNRRFVPLALLERSRYEEHAELLSPILDGREPACVWHRFLFDGCLPPETSVEVWSHACDEKENIDFAPWRKEPNPYRRGHGSELPFTRKETSKDAGTFEFLFQEARGQFLQLKLVLRGEGRSTPRLHALRIYYPRFSYLTHYLPAVYRENTTSASFLDRFLANVEGTNTAIEDRIAAAQLLFDVRSAPPETLAWLGAWFGIALDPAWDEQRQRLLLSHAVKFFQWRGTAHGLQMSLRLAFDEFVDDSIFDLPQRGRCVCDAASKKPGKVSVPGERFRIVEHFLLRSTPAVELGDPTLGDGPQLMTNERWNPSLGANALRLRFQNSTGRTDWTFEPGDGATVEETSARQSFALRELGFVPSKVSEDQQGWREFLQKRYRTCAALASAHGQALSNFSEVSIPADQPTNATALRDWRDYIADPDPQPYAIRRALWQDFLERRYSIVRELNSRYGTHWDDFKWISYPTALPNKVWLLSDWFQFESVVLPMHAAAHRFSVLLPFTGSTLAAQEDRTQKLELGRRIIDLEKPAHTTYDLKFYWALFRVGEARLGIDTSLGLGGRDPALLPPAMLGQTYLAETQLTASHPFNVTERQIVGRDHLK